MNDRSKETVSRLLGNKINYERKEEKSIQEIVPDKKSITKLIRDAGASKRVGDSIRLHPILIAALKYWTTIAEPSKAKPDVVEQALLKVIPEEYLIEGYKLAKKREEEKNI